MYAERGDVVPEAYRDATLSSGSESGAEDERGQLPISSYAELSDVSLYFMCGKDYN